MEVKLGRYDDDPRRVDKTYTVTKTLQMNPIETTDLMNPVLTCDYDSSILLCNYAEIADFNRKYFVDPPEIVRGGRMIFTFHVDVLECGFENCLGTIVRNEYITESDVEDSNLPLKFGRIKPLIQPLAIDVSEYDNPSTVYWSYFDYLLTR